jgi:ABC-type transport system substrate-binding protein
MAFMKKAIVALAALWLIGVSCQCSKAGGTTRSARKKDFPRIRAFIFLKPISLIPVEGEHYVDGQFTEIIFNNLVQANYLGSLSPELAESWEISPDHRLYTFYLRRNVRFHNGRPFTAADVVFTLEKLIEKAQGKYAEINYIDGYEEFLGHRTRHVRGIRVINDHTLQIRLNEEFKFFLQFMSAEYMAILPAGYAGMSEEVFRRQPVGTGPFRLVHTGSETIAARQYLVFRLEKHSGYFAPSGNLGGIDFYTASGPVAANAKEHFDILFISSSEIPELSGKPEYRVINSSPGVLNFLLLNPSENEWMRERKVRQLINYAINREELVRRVFQNQALPAHSMMPFGLLGYNPYYRLDYARAAMLRSELPPGKISFTLMTVASDERHRVAEFVREELAKFNVDVKVTVINDEYDYFTNRIYNTRSSVMMGGIPDYPASYHFLTHLLEPNGYYNAFHFAFPELQARIRTLPGADTVSEARTLTEINAAFESDSLYIPLYHYANFIAIHNRVKAVGFKYGEVVDFAGLEVEE